MTTLRLLDTGYIGSGTATNQTRLANSLRAGYTGTAVTSMTLKVQNIELNSEVKTEDKPVINQLTDSQTTLVSVDRQRFNINGIMYKTFDTTNYNVNDLVQLARYERTRGMKLIYPSDNNEEAGMRNIIEGFGMVNRNGGFAGTSATDTLGIVGTAVPYLIGRVKGFRVSDNETGDYWRYSFTFEVSG